jgi:hypothetical protein
MSAGIIAFVLIDAVILLVIVVAVLASRGRLVDFGVKQPGVDVRSLVALAKEEHERFGEYMRTSWDGTAERLPEALESLLRQFDEKARARGLILNRQTLKSVVSSSLIAHGSVRPRVLKEALQKVA